MDSLRKEFKAAYLAELIWLAIQFSQAKDQFGPEAENVANKLKVGLENDGYIIFPKDKDTKNTLGTFFSSFTSRFSPPPKEVADDKNTLAIPSIIDAIHIKEINKKDKNHKDIKDNDGKPVTFKPIDDETLQKIKNKIRVRSTGQEFKVPDVLDPDIRYNHAMAKRRGAQPLITSPSPH